MSKVTFTPLTPPPPAFTPIRLTIDIMTKEELQALYMVCNVGAIDEATVRAVGSDIMNDIFAVIRNHPDAENKEAHKRFIQSLIGLLGRQE